MAIENRLVAYQEALHGLQVAALWNQTLPGYELDGRHLQNLLAHEKGLHWVVLAEQLSESSRHAISGFVITFKDSDTKGFVSAVCVQKAHRRGGIGSALLNHGRLQLQQTGCRDISIGSGSPYFWPGLPTDLDESVEAFLSRNGFWPSSKTLAKDLQIDLQDYKPPTEALLRAAQESIVFRPWTADDYEECMAQQRANFGDNAQWVSAFKKLGASHQHRQVMVAHDSAKGQVGWTLMIEPGLPVLDQFAFPRLLGDDTALIGCVGVDARARKRGIGHALVAYALLDLQARGMKHVFVDWVVLADWYERLGFRVWRSYKQVKYCNQTVTP